MILNTELGSSDMFTGLDFRGRNNWSDFFSPGLIISDHVSSLFIIEFYGEEVERKGRQRSAFWQRMIH